MEAIQYSQRVTSSLQKLDNLHDRVLKLSQGLELDFYGIDKITFYTKSEWGWVGDYYEGTREQGWTPREPDYTRTTTFHEQMDFIKVYLKVLGTDKCVWQVLTKEELDIYEGIEGLKHKDIKWSDILKRTKSYIKWLKNAINKCDRMLQIKYQPGGEVFQQAQERNIGRYGIQK